MKNKHFKVAAPNEFSVVITEVLQQAAVITDQAALIALTGDLGVGKTTFTQQLALHLGITEPVVSPTFGIMKTYELHAHPDFDQLVHIDAYRIADESEVGPLRLREVFSAPRTLVCLEWPENIAQTIPDTKIALHITIANGEERLVVMESAII